MAKQALCYQCVQLAPWNLDQAIYMPGSNLKALNNVFLFNERHHFKGDSNFKDDNGVIWYCDAHALSTGSPKPKNLNDGNRSGYNGELMNGKPHNTLVYWGAGSQIETPTHTFKGSDKSCWMRNVVGVSMVWNTRGSFSDTGGDAQAWPVKMGGIYAHPITKERKIRSFSKKLQGGKEVGTDNKSLNNKPLNQNDNYSVYSLKCNSEGDPFYLVKEEGWLFGGFICQFYHGVKSSKHTTRWNVKQVNPLVQIDDDHVWNPNKVWKTPSLFFGHPEAQTLDDAIRGKWCIAGNAD